MLDLTTGAPQPVTRANTSSFLNGSRGLATQTVNTTQTRSTRDPAGDVISLRIGGNDYFYLTDRQGSVIAITDSTDSTGKRAAGNTYPPYGANRYAIASTGDSTIRDLNPIRRHTGYLDTATGTYKMGYRYYTPNLGRFNQTDPTGQETNNYLYAGASAINFTDPSGALFGITKADLAEAAYRVGTGISCAVVGAAAAALAAGVGVAAGVGCGVAAAYYESSYVDMVVNS